MLLPAPDMTNAALLVATVFAAGLVEPLRASLALALAFPLIVAVNRFRYWLPAAACIGFVAGLGWWAADAWGAASGTTDDRRIVIDEVAGALAAAASAGRMGAVPLAGFALLFLVLDRLKPWPFSELERLTGAWGVMADDLVIGMALGLAVRFGRKLAGRRLGKT